MISTALHERLQVAAGDRTYRHLGELTRTHPETVRRYMQGQTPNAEFLAELCAALSISGDWLLTGRGPMRLDEQRAHALRGATAADLLAAMAATIERLGERIDRLETYIQTLETRMSSLSPDPAVFTATPLQEEPGHGSLNGQSSAAEAGPRPGASGAAAGFKPPADPSPERVRRLQRALAQRPRPHAD